MSEGFDVSRQPKNILFFLAEAASVGGLFHIRSSLRCRLLAPNGHADAIEQCPLSGPQQTSFARSEYFAF